MLGRQVLHNGKRSGVNTAVPADPRGLLDERSGTQRDFSEPMVGDSHPQLAFSHVSVGQNQNAGSRYIDLELP